MKSSRRDLAPGRSRSVGLRMFAVGAVALGAAACSSSSKTTTPPTTTAGSATTSGTTGGSTPTKTIEIGGIIAETGTTPFTGTNEAISAYFKQVDAQGGINGYTIKYVSYDSAGSAQTNSALMTQLISQHAVAVIDEDEQGAPGGYAIAEQAGVPVIGNYSLPVQFQNPDLYPVAPYYQGALGKVMLQVMANENAKKIALLTINVPSAVNAEKIDATDASQFGLSVVTNDLYPPTTTDFTAYVSKVVSSGAQAVFVIGTIGNGEVVSKALQQQGSNAKVIFTEYDAAIASHVGSWGNDKVFSTTPLATLPPRADVAAALKQYGYSSVDATSSFVAEGWTDAQIAAQGVKLLGSNSPSGANMVAALNSISNFKGTYTPPITYGSGPHGNPSQCIQVQEMVNGVLGLYKGQPYECFTGSVAPS